MAAAGRPDIGKLIGDTLLSTLQGEEEKLDAEIADLDRKKEEDELESIRRKRLEQMRKVAKQKEAWRRAGHGAYNEITDQKTFFDELKGSKRAVVHFYRPSAWRCDVLHKHLGALATRHIETKFVRINAEKAPFLCERLKIWMIPSMVLVKEGKTEHTIQGFDELGGDKVTGKQLEDVLLAHEMLLEAYCQ